MTMRRIIILTILLLTPALVAFPKGFFKSHKNKIVIPFKLENNLIIIQVGINNDNKLNFILDTGLKNTIITELSYNDTLQINEASATTLRGLGGDEPIKVYESKNNKLIVDGIAIYNQDLYVIMENVFHMSERFGMQIHGILGHYTFKNYISEIDYTNRKLTLYNRETYKYPTSKRWQKLPIEVINDKPYMFGKIINEAGDTVDVKLLIDTGASQALWIDERTSDKLSVPLNNIPANLGMGLNGQITGRVGRLPELLIGKFKFKGVVSGFPDPESLSDYLKIDNRHGSLGSDICRRFKFVIDYQGGFVYLKKNSRYREPFFYNASGIEIGTPDVSQSVFHIYGVDEKSEAYKAGLRVGDELFSINGEFLYGKKLKEVNAIFDIKNSKEFRLNVLRDGELKHVFFKLKKRI